jgi:hypothetical protein
VNITDYINEIISDIKKESPDNLFIQFLESISDINYGIYEKRDFFIDKYDDLIELYISEHMDDKTQGN